MGVEEEVPKGDSLAQALKTVGAPPGVDMGEFKQEGPGRQATYFRKASQSLKGGRDGKEAAVGVCHHGPGKGLAHSRPSLRHKRGWISLEPNLTLDGPLGMGGNKDPGPWGVDVGGVVAGIQG